MLIFWAQISLTKCCFSFGAAKLLRWRAMSDMSLTAPHTLIRQRHSISRTQTSTLGVHTHTHNHATQANKTKIYSNENDIYVSNWTKKTSIRTTGRPRGSAIKMNREPFCRERGREKDRENKKPKLCPRRDFHLSGQARMASSHNKPSTN